MTPINIILVKDSFRKIVPIADQAAALFYARLFELDPSLRPLFHGDLREQGRKLMNMLAAAVSALERLDAIVPAVRELGARHAGFGVRDEVQDTGPGVPADERQQLFREHARLSPRPTAGEESNSLGLSIVKHLVESQSGTVGADFAATGGSTFWFELPALPAPAS